MNKIIPVVLLFGGLTIFSGWIGKTVTTSTSQLTAMAASATMESKQAAKKADFPQNAQLTRVNLDRVQPSAEIKPQVETPKAFNFNNVNGISLNDNMKTVIDKLGQPLSTEKDEFTPEIVVYAYPEMSIGFSSGIVSYVEVLVAAGTAKIDGISIPIDDEGLKNALGEPDFVAEDGIVFQRHAAFVKLFTDMETKQVTSLHYYHRSSI